MKLLLKVPRDLLGTVWEVLKMSLNMLSQGMTQPFWTDETCKGRVNMKRALENKNNDHKIDIMEEDSKSGSGAG